MRGPGVGITHVVMVGLRVVRVKQSRYCIISAFSIAPKQKLHDESGTQKQL